MSEKEKRDHFEEHSFVPSINRTSVYSGKGQQGRKDQIMDQKKKTAKKAEKVQERLGGTNTRSHLFDSLAFHEEMLT
ncbi:hypothetical protein T4D_9320 [Trichinella pseudospiralis]|uniref:Uncharacterized protein n=1 Tax=Trichinella pseudospiralis TaxID=6337 RepID=A0A0V1FIU0_TRIPS|nr:hypothetical protein T4D_9320 [Trichinella pseudospiralis]